MYRCTLIGTKMNLYNNVSLSPPSGEPFLLSSVQTDLLLLGLRSGSLDVLLSSAKKAILSVDYDWKEQRVFWVTVDTDSIRWSSLDRKTTGTLIKGQCRWCYVGS